ncbi:DUF2971 domain-containing protein [Marinomonas fungiae]|uniref:DUF2971 domain-containing protein n=1 Tax=Marinomonas fungiae TaxID=1137284 RepID=UPI003A8D0656
MTNIKTLYHYTNLAAAMNIVETCEVWATDYRYLNDSGELQYALDLLFERAGEYQSDFKKHIFYFLERSVICVFSLSESPEILSQWRSYAADGAGVALGFSIESISELNPKKCFYKEEYIDQIFEDIKTKLIKLIEIERFKPELYSHQYFYDFTTDHFDEYIEIVKMLMLLKNPAFSEEQEWRVVEVLDISNPSVSGKLVGQDC